MLYCPKCQSLQETDAQVCEICQEPILREPAPEDIVLLAEGLSKPDADRLCEALSDAQIIFECKDSAVLVSYEFWQQACDLVANIGLNPEEPSDSEEEPEGSKKKLISRIVLFAFFIGIVWAVVALSDTVIAFVKGLFTGG